MNIKDSLRESLQSEFHTLPNKKHSVEELDEIFEKVAKRDNRQPTPSENECIKHVRITRKIAEQNTAEMLKVNNFNKPTL